MVFAFGIGLLVDVSGQQGMLHFSQARDPTSGIFGGPDTCKPIYFSDL